MKLITHIQYFLYIAVNWGLRIALFTLKEELKGERKYRINSTSYSKLSRYQLTGNQLAHATEYMPVNYFTLEQLFHHLPHDARKGIFLDIGCGKGRAMCVAAAAGFKQVAGIDFAKQLIDAAEINLHQTKELHPSLEYNLFWKDVEGLEIEQQVRTIFLFNPFDERLMQTVIQKINESLRLSPRTIYIMYASPRHEDLFFADKYDVVFRIKKFNYLEGVILKKQ